MTRITADTIFVPNILSSVRFAPFFSPRIFLAAERFAPSRAQRDLNWSFLVLECGQGTGFYSVSQQTFCRGHRGAQVVPPLMQTRVCEHSKLCVAPIPWHLQGLPAMLCSFQLITVSWSSPQEAGGSWLLAPVGWEVASWWSAWCWWKDRWWMGKQKGWWPPGLVRCHSRRCWSLFFAFTSSTCFPLSLSFGCDAYCCFSKPFLPFSLSFSFGCCIRGCFSRPGCWASRGLGSPGPPFLNFAAWSVACSPAPLAWRRNWCWGWKGRALANLVGVTLSGGEVLGSSTTESVKPCLFWFCAGLVASVCQWRKCNPFFCFHLLLTCRVGVGVFGVVLLHCPLHVATKAKPVSQTQLHVGTAYKPGDAWTLPIQHRSFHRRPAGHKKMNLSTQTV